MPPKKKVTHLKEARKLAKLRKIEAKSEILVENTSFLFKDESIKGSQILENDTLCHKNCDWKKDNESEDDVRIIDNDEDVLDMDIFTKLLRAVQDSSSFESHKPYFYMALIFSNDKKGGMHNINANQSHRLMDINLLQRDF